MISFLSKRTATLRNSLSTVALRLCGRLGSKRFKAWVQKRLEQNWYTALNAAPTVELSLQDLMVYTPVRLKVSPAQKSVTWLKTGRLRATDPFFEQILFRSWLGRIRPRLGRTGIDKLVEMHKTNPGLAPAGFVFHLSRCGSTLISNILSVPSNCRVLPEPFIVSNLLMTSEEALPLSRRKDLLTALISVLARPQSPDQKYLFLKFTSWNVLYLDFIKKVYPEVPCMFLYRHPLEVAVSNLKDQMAWMEAKYEPGLLQQHLGIADTSKLGAEEFYARAIAKYGDAALNSLDSNAMFVNYRDLRESFIPELLSFFKIDPTTEELQRMRECFQFHSKDATRKKKHTDDSQKKVSMASVCLREMVDRYAVTTYEALEQRQKVS